MRGKETQAKRKINARRIRNSHLYLLSSGAAFPHCTHLFRNARWEQYGRGGLFASLHPSGKRLYQEATGMGSLGGLCPIVGKGSRMWLPKRAYAWSDSSKPPPHPCTPRSIRSHPSTSQDFIRARLSWIVFCAPDVGAKPFARFSGARGCLGSLWVSRLGSAECWVSVPTLVRQLKSWCQRGSQEFLPSPPAIKDGHWSDLDV